MASLLAQAASRGKKGMRSDSLLFRGSCWSWAPFGGCVGDSLLFGGRVGKLLHPRGLLLVGGRVGRGLLVFRHGAVRGVLGAAGHAAALLLLRVLQTPRAEVPRRGLREVVVRVRPLHRAVLLRVNR